MKKIVKTLCFLVLCFQIFQIKISASNLLEIIPNKSELVRLRNEDRTLTFKVKIPKNSYQNFEFDYKVNNNNIVGDGFKISVYDEENKIIHEVEGIKQNYKSGNFGLKKGSVVFIKISDSFDYVDPINGIDISFKFNIINTNKSEIEKNDNFRNATILYSNNEIRGALHTPKDEDYFKYKILSKGKFKFTLKTNSYSQISNGWNMEIFDSKKNLIHSSKNIIYSHTTKDLHYKKGEILYIKISASLATDYPEMLDYFISVKTKDVKNFEAEDNDKFKNANILSNRIEGFLLNNDVDIFKFSSLKSQKYTFSVSPKNTNESKITVRFYKKNKKKPILEEIIGNSQAFTIKMKKNEMLWLSLTSGNQTSSSIIEYKITAK